LVGTLENILQETDVPLSVYFDVELNPFTKKMISMQFCVLNLVMIIDEVYAETLVALNEFFHDR